MGCFLGCFGGAKSKERRHRRRKHSSSSPNAHARARCSPRKADRDAEAVSAAAPLLSTLLELRDSTDDLCLTVVKKKVTFDSNVTAYEAPAIPEGEEEAAGGGGKGEEEEEAAWKGEEEEAAAWMLGPGCAKSEAFPLNHRYGNCGGGAGDDDSDDEEYYSDDEDEYEDGEEEEYEDGIDAINDDEEDHGCGLLGIARGEEEACESLFLLPVVRAKETAAEAPAPCGTRERSQPVLSSVENFAEWKDATKPRTAAPKNSDKENVVTLVQENRSTDALSDAIAAKKKERPAVSADYTPSTPSKQEASVDASLSTWLGSTGTPESKSNSVRSYSPISREERPILGALTVEDIKISSANSSPMRSRSPSPSPDDMPILGTVGAYWNCSANGGDDSVTRGGFMKSRSRFGQEQKW